jgi:hypothetical protein
MVCNKIAYALFFVFLSGCSSENTEGPEKTGEKRGVVSIEESDVFSSMDYEFVLPQPFALAANFQEAGLIYDAQRMNPINNATNYKTKGKKLLNFGVYSTNLVYTILNDQPQASMEYFKTLHDLAESLGMGAVFTEDNLAGEIEGNIANKDVLEDLLIDVHERSQEFLQDNDMRQLAAVQFTGAWIEAMYLAAHDFGTEVSDDLSAKIDDQMTLLSNAIFALETFESREEDIIQVLGELQELKKTYEGFESVQNPVGGIPRLTNADVAVISSQIKAIRELVVG